MRNIKSVFNRHRIADWNVAGLPFWIKRVSFMGLDFGWRIVKMAQWKM